MTKAKKVEPKKPVMTAEQIKAKLRPDAGKKIIVRVPIGHFRNQTLDYFSQRAFDAAEKAGIVGGFTLNYSAPENYGYRYHNKRPAAIRLTGKRPYTDEELLKEGVKVIQREEKAAKEAAEKKRKQIQQIAAQAGVTVEIDDPS